ncbi:hypothetical protein [Gemmata sp.]|uniref:hypothetical protein n=1 Tax=Gemmata sp. TaxID=1914242 RepID=UPI003F70FA99
MKRANRGGKRVVPQPGGEVFIQDEAAPLIYSMPMPPVKSRGRLIPADGVLIVDQGHAFPPVAATAPGDVLAPDRPLVPTADEVAALPRTARHAFLARCAARVAPLAPAAGEIDAQQAAALILAAATVQTPVRRLLRRIRRDFDKLVYLAKQRKWTDDTSVPPDALGPLWPEDVKLPWAK